MVVPSIRRLLGELDGDSHGGRVRTMALLGRENAGGPELAALLDRLSEESEYHHRLALVAAAASGDDERLRSALTHASPRLRSFALARLGSLAVPRDAMLRAFLDGSAEERRRLRRFVNRNGRIDVAEAVIDEVRQELGDREAGALLAACGDATVRRLLPEVLYAMGSLASLAGRHPGPLLDHLESELAAATPSQRDSLWGQVGTALDALTKLDPDRVLRLVEEWGPSNVIPSGLAPILGRLIRLAPGRVALLLVRGEYVQNVPWQLPAALRRGARSFAHADRVAIARALRRYETVFFLFIGRLAPADRGRVSPTRSPTSTRRRGSGCRATWRCCPTPFGTRRFGASWPCGPSARATATDCRIRHSFRSHRHAPSWSPSSPGRGLRTAPWATGCSSPAPGGSGRRKPSPRSWASWVACVTSRIRSVSPSRRRLSWYLRSRSPRSISTTFAR